MRSNFDEYAEDYDNAISQGLRFSGEDRHYFARKRVEWLARLLAAREHRATSVIDYGCGTGDTAPLFCQLLSASRVLGVDLSAKSIEVATKKHGAQTVSFSTLANYSPDASFDLAFCNGVFHHIPIAERPSCVRYVFESLQPGGIFAFWENNPWNAGTQFIMAHCEFDKDAIMLSIRESRQLLKAAGFQIVHSSSLFFFPKALRVLRPAEKALSVLPLGGQYQILARKPA